MQAYAIDERPAITARLADGADALLGRLSRRFGGGEPVARDVAADAAALARAGDRLVLGMSARFTEPLPADTLLVVQRYLSANPRLRLEYVGRGSVVCEREPDDGAIIHMDRPGGRRRYYFRKLANDGRMPRRCASGELLADFDPWLNDPDSKLVVSIGGGGFRLFGATPILKALDHLLGDRSKIAEVWGSSGGALAGYVLSQGFAPEVLDELGFDLSHNRNPSLANGSLASMVRMRMRIAHEALARDKGASEMERWLAHLDRMPHARPHAKLPLFSVAVNPGKQGLHALGAAEHIPEYCRDFLMPSDPRAAVAASTAVPFLLRPERGITGRDRDVWVDGSLADEHPLTLPFVKWKRERAHAPESARKKLKILLVSLNARTQESPLVRTLSRVPWVGTHGVKRAARLLDIALDSRLHQVVQLLSEVPDVEVRCVKLSLDRLGLRSPDDIPSVIHGGRQAAAWEVVSFRGAM